MPHAAGQPGSAQGRWFYGAARRRSELAQKYLLTFFTIRDRWILRLSKAFTGLSMLDFLPACAPDAASLAAGLGAVKPENEPDNMAPRPEVELSGLPDGVPG